MITACIVTVWAFAATASALWTAGMWVWTVGVFILRCPQALSKHGYVSAPESIHASQSPNQAEMHFVTIVKHFHADGWGDGLSRQKCSIQALGAVAG